MNFFDLHVEDLKVLTNKLKRFHKRYVSCFHTKTRNVSKQSLQYLKGIFIEKGRGNMVNYAKNIPDTNNQVLQNFISDSPWDEKSVIDQIQEDVTQLIGDKNNGSIHIDESGFKKSGGWCKEAILRSSWESG